MQNDGFRKQTLYPSYVNSECKKNYAQVLNSGVDESAVQNVVSQLVPAVSKGIKNNAVSTDGLGGLINALSQGNHQHYIDNPNALTESSALDEGNAILGHVFGNKEVSRNVASHAAESTGVNNEIVKYSISF